MYRNVDDWKSVGLVDLLCHPFQGGEAESEYVSLNDENNRTLAYRSCSVGFLDSNDRFRYLTDSSKQSLPSVIKNFEGDDAGSLRQSSASSTKFDKKTGSTFATPNWFPAIVALTSRKSEKWPKFWGWISFLRDMSSMPREIAVPVVGWVWRSTVNAAEYAHSASLLKAAPQTARPPNSTCKDLIRPIHESVYKTYMIGINTC